MIEVISFRVRSYSIDNLDLFWTLNEQDDERIDEYDFFIYRSIDGAGGPFELIAGPFFNTFQFRDPNVQLLHKWRNYFYKIRLVHRASQKERYYGPAHLEAPPDRIAAEIQRRESLLFKELAGRAVIFYPKLTFGQRCRHCWDKGVRGNSIGRTVQQGCLTCFDTSFVGGYATPIIVHVQIDPSPNTEQKTDTKQHLINATTARTSSFPPIKSGDMIVEAENQRWLVDSVSYTEKHRATVRQELRLTMYGKDDIKYSVPVNMDLLYDNTPKRDFTRPMSLQNQPVQAVKERV